MTYTNEQISVALRAALDARGEDYVYETGMSGDCDYARGGEPSCIVGFVAHALDPEMFLAIEDYEEDYDKNLGDKSFRAVANRLRLPFEPHQVTALGDIQRQQDKGVPWGEVVASEWVAVLGERL